MNRKTLVIAVAISLQVAAISCLIWRYERIVTRGTEVRFACQAYDPYDPLRGRYLRTSVQEPCTNMAFQVCEENRFELRNKLFARLEAAGTNDLWRVAEVALEPGTEGMWVRPKSSHFDYHLAWSARKQDEDWDDFNQRQKQSGLMAIVAFPDQLFINEKLAPEAESILRKRTGESAVAVYRVLDGEMVITDIEIDGKPIVQFIREEMQ